MLFRFVAAGAAAISLVVLPAQPAAAAPASPVTKRLAVVMIQNGDTPAEQTQLADEAFAQGLFFGSSDSLATWMPAVTHGLLNYTAAGTGVYLVPPNDALSTGDRDATCLSDAARVTAEDYLSANTIAWDSVAILFDIGGGCKWAGLGQMPGKVTWFPPRPSLSAVVHEFGHNQGYPHEPKRDCASGMIANCKVNDYSGNTPMGSGGSGKGYSSVELLHSKWVETDWFTQTSKPGTFTLKPLYAPTSTTGTRIVEYNTGGSTSYVIETRAQGTEVDTGISSPGIRVYSVSGHDYKNGWMVNAGGSTVITDATNHIAITIRSATSFSVSVIEASAAPSALPSASPTPEVSPTPSTVDDGDTVIFPEPPRSSSSSGGAKPPWVAFGIAVISLLGIGVAFLFAKHKGRHRFPRKGEASLEYFEGNYYESDY